MSNRKTVAANIIHHRYALRLFDICLLCGAEFSERYVNIFCHAKINHIFGQIYANIQPFTKLTEPMLLLEIKCLVELIENEKTIDLRLT